jgi:DNA-3-methyladenine glycosylase II
MTMHIIMSDTTAQQAADWLSQHDPLLKPVIDKYGPCPIRPHTDYYRELVESIIGQQLSVKAAASIQARFLTLYDNTFPQPKQILETSVDDLRAVGFSRAKALYVHDLAQHMLDGKIDFGRFDNLSNQDIATELVAVKGVGEWTAHMFLMWCMGRTDILPHGDLGIRNGIRQLYKLQELPDRSAIETIAINNHWHPYESVASWYIWQSLDNAPKA